MRFHVLLAASALCATLTACSRIEEAAMPVVAKINAAHPVSADVRLAQDLLMTMLADDAKARDEVNALVDVRMTMRALSCSKSIPIGRFDSVASVKALSMDTPCFQEQDRELQKLYGIRTIGVLLAKPPLRPLKAVGPSTLLPKGKAPYISSGAIARDANVGILLDGRGDGVVLEIPSGTPIAQLAQLGSVSQPDTRVSPNGRVVTFNPHGQGPVFVDAETGNRIWTVGGNHSTRLLAWLPEVNSVALSGFDGDTMLADGLKGTLEVHPLSIKNSAYAAHIPGKPARLLMGTSREFVLVEHTRTPQGITAAAVKQYTITSGQGITSGQPVPMRSGRLVVYASMRDIGWLDLDSGHSGAWRSSPYFGIPFAKLDEEHLLFDSSDYGRTAAQTWSFDIVNETVSSSELSQRPGTLIDIGDRIGFLRRGNEAWFGDTVQAGAAQSLDKVVADFELQQQLARLQAMSEREALMNGAFEQRADGQIGIRGSSQPGMPSMPGLNGVPLDAEVHMVGVYEGKREARQPGNQAPANVRVLARSSGRPVILSLSSCESVNWVVVNNGARISAVLLSGYKPSTVSGVGNVPVLRIGSNHAYTAGSSDYVRLRQSVAQYTGAREIRSFQGAYSGGEFSVGGR